MVSAGRQRQLHGVLRVCKLSGRSKRTICRVLLAGMIGRRGRGSRWTGRNTADQSAILGSGERARRIPTSFVYCVYRVCTAVIRDRLADHREHRQLLTSFLTVCVWLFGRPQVLRLPRDAGSPGRLRSGCRRGPSLLAPSARPALGLAKLGQGAHCSTRSIFHGDRT